jgi:hypothetical protein
MVQGYPISFEELYGNKLGLNLIVIERVSKSLLSMTIELLQASQRP